MNLSSLLLCAGLACATAAPCLAQSGYDPTKVADPRFSWYTPLLVGCASGDSIETRCPGTSAPSVGFVIAPRDINGAPISSGHTVELQFLDPALRLYAEQEPGATFDCTLRLLRKTLLLGEAVFHPRFGGSAQGQAVLVGAEGVILGYVPARSTDMDAQGGSTGLGDLELFARAYGASSTVHPEADFDGSGGLIGLGDLAIFAHEFASGAQGTYCP